MTATAPASEPRAPLRIANCSGYFGDRVAAADEMVDGGPIDVLTGDWLAELTMLILARTREKRPDGAYARSFVDQMESVMGRCLDRGIKVVSNAGGLDPRACAEAVAAVADRLGLSPSVAFVEGDDLLPRLDTLSADRVELRHFHTDAALGDDRSRLVTANAYLGCWGIVEALDRGADIVITGRATDAAIVCGPAAWYHKWRRDEWDALAGAVVAGHVIECGTQATGGNYSFFREVPGLVNVGFPWAEVAFDGSSVIGKHDGTGGLVSIGTVTSQLLYEIGSPRYLGPDVTARFDTIQLDEIDRDRVRISGVRGEPPPPTLKVALNEDGGYRNDVGVAIAGLDVDAKAEIVEAAFWSRCPVPREQFESVTTRLVRRDKCDPATNDEALAEWWLTVKDPDPHKAGRAVSNAVVELMISTIPGFFLLSGMPAAGRRYGVYQPYTVASEAVRQHVTLLGRATTEVSSVAPAALVVVSTPSERSVQPPRGATRRVPLGALAATRSGDKGGDANLGVFVRSDVAWAWLDEFLTADRLRELLPETSGLPIDRYRLPNLRAVNFVVRGLLEQGVAASTRRDGQAKSLGEWLRSRLVDMPRELIDPD